MSITVGVPSTSLPDGFVRAGKGKAFNTNPGYDAIYGAIVAAAPKWVPINGTETSGHKEKWAMYAGIISRVRRDFKGSRKLETATDARDRKMYLRLVHVP